jgi:hypothetical protein
MSNGKAVFDPVGDKESKKWGWIFEIGSDVDIITGYMYAGCPGYGLEDGDINYSEGSCDLVGTFSVNTGYDGAESAGCTITLCDGVTSYDEHCSISTERPTSKMMDAPGQYSYGDEGCDDGEPCYIMVHIKVGISDPIILCPA